MLVHDPACRRGGHPRGSGLMKSAAHPLVHGLFKIVVLVLKLTHPPRAEVPVPVLVRPDDAIDILLDKSQVNSELPPAKPICLAQSR